MDIKKKLKWLDPFTYVDLYFLPVINPSKSSIVSNIVYIVFAFVFAFLLYNFLGLILGTNAPLVIVVSGSMEPIMYRGDIVLMHGIKTQNINALQVELNQSSLESLPLTSYAVPFCAFKNSSEQKPCSSFIASNPQNFNTVSIKFSNNQLIPVTTAGDIIVYNSNISSQPVIHRVIAKIKTSENTFVLTKGDSSFNPLIDQQAGITFGAVKQEQIQGKAVFRIPLLGYIKLLIFDDIPLLFFGCKNPAGCPFP